MRLFPTGLVLAVLCLTSACAQPDAHLKARVDHLDNRLRELDRAKRDADIRIADLENRLAASSYQPDGPDRPDRATPEKEHTAPVEGPQYSLEPAAQSGSQTDQTTPPSPPRLRLVQPAAGRIGGQTQTPTAQADIDIPDDYQTAYKAYESGRHVEARRLFTQFTEKNPRSPLQANALYWIGETHYSEKSFAQAILAFREVVKRYPKHPKAPDALIKTGMAYERLGDKENAALYLKAMLDDYPKAERAELARKLLGDLGK